jgi:hypothetical protein
MKRAGWHRPAGLIPLAYLVAIVAVALAHTLVPYQIWLLIHLLLLGAATNAILVWSAHFAAAILKPRSVDQHGATVRLGVLNTGVLAVLAGGTVGPAWVGVAGSAVVFAAIAVHLWMLATWLRRSLPARFAVVVRYYLAAGVALMLGIPAGAWMLVIADDQRPRLLLFHAHVNLLGWITLTVLGTLLTLWPTVLRTRMVEGAPAAAHRALPVAVAGLAGVGVGVLAWWPWVAAAGLVLFGGAVVLVALPMLATARQSVLAPMGARQALAPGSFATWSIAAAVGWLLVALAWDAVTLVTAPDVTAAADGFDAVIVPLGVGFVAQVLLGSLAFLLPMVLGGGPGPVRERLAMLDAHWSQRVTMANAALAVFLLPVPPYVRVATSLLVLAALVQFLVPAVRILLIRTKASSVHTIHIGR